MRLMPAPGSGRWLCLTSPSTAAPPRWPCPRAGGPTRCWAGCTPLTRAAPTRLRSAAPADAVPFLPTPRSRTRRGGLRGPAHGGHPPHRRGGSSPALDVAPPGRLGPRALRAGVLSRDDPRGPAPPQAVLEESQEVAGTGRPGAATSVHISAQTACDFGQIRPPVSEQSATDFGDFATAVSIPSATAVG